MSDHERHDPSRGEPRRRSWGRAGLALLEPALWLFGAICLTWAAWSWADARLYQRSAGAELTQARLAGDGGTAPTRGEGAEGRGASRGPETGSPIARIRAPRLLLDAVVAEGSEAFVLRRAVGRVKSGARPGEPGNVVLAAHRDTFFRPLEKVRVGDEIVVESRAGEDRYEVEEIQIVNPDAVEVLADRGRPTLTLVTCYPFRFVGAAPRRFVVRARHLSGPARGGHAEPLRPAA